MARIYTQEERRVWFDSLPAKPCSSAGLIFDEKGQVLLVKPSYRTVWQWPGGVVEPNERPSHAVVREIREELGVDLTGRLEPAYLHYLSPREGHKDILHFLFTTTVDDGAAFLETLTLQEEEIEAARFVPIEDIHHFTEDHRAVVVKDFVKRRPSGGFLFYEDGESIR